MLHPLKILKTQPKPQNPRKVEKRFKKVITNPETGRKKTVKFGAVGTNIDPGSKRAKAYCARSAKIKGDWKSDPNSPNSLSRKKWKC